MMYNYCYDMIVEKTASLVKQMEKSVDYVFKKETQCANDERDENNESGVFYRTEWGSKLNYTEPELWLEWLLHVNKHD